MFELNMNYLFLFQTISLKLKYSHAVAAKIIPKNKNQHLPYSTFCQF